MSKIQKAIEISDAKIQFVSLVDKAANKRQFLVTKQENEILIKASDELKKALSEQIEVQQQQQA